MPAVTTIELRRGTAAAWTAANPVLATAEPGYETDTGKIKYGDNSTAWNSLPYFTVDANTLSGTTLKSTVTASSLTSFGTSPTLITPILGTPTSVTLTNATGLPLTTGVTGVLPVANGGTGDSSLTVYAPLFGGTTTTGPIQSGTVGTTGQVLTSNGAGALPTFQTPGAGSSELVLLATATASSSATLDFTSVISSSYSSYIMEFSNVLSSTTGTFNLAASIDNGGTWTRTVQGQVAKITSNNSTAPTYTGTSDATGAGVPLMDTSGSQFRFSGLIFFSDLIQGNTQSTFFSNAFSNNTSSTVSQCTGTIAATTNALRILPSSGTISSGKIYFYGIKNT